MESAGTEAGPSKRPDRVLDKECEAEKDLVNTGRRNAIKEWPALVRTFVDYKVSLMLGMRCQHELIESDGVRARWKSSHR